jgi:acetamidase/formamidase
MSYHMIPATPETVQWGRFDARIPPVATVESGSTVTIQCVTGLAELYPPEGSGMTVSPALRAINEANLPVRWGHLLTGPVAIDGAEPGDLLEVQILDIELGADWGFNAIEPFDGTLPGDFIMARRVLTHIPINQAERTARLPWGPKLSLMPFFGVMGVAPPPEYGELSSREPRLHGGNLDNKELSAGSTLFLPVWASGALFSCGDGHGTQGDGEVCVTALETALTGTFKFTLHKANGEPLARLPRAETPSHYLSMGFDADLDEALRIAVREMIALITARTAMSRQEAYQFCSLVADFRITQSVNGEKGVHGMLAKSLLAEQGAQ